MCGRCDWQEDLQGAQEALECWRTSGEGRQVAFFFSLCCVINEVAVILQLYFLLTS